MSYNPPLMTGPIALYNNVPINFNGYSPEKYVISAVTQGLTTVITTSADHDFVIGSTVRIIIPVGYGIRELNEVQAMVISLPSATQVELDLDSTGMTAFRSSTNRTSPQIKPIGDFNSGQQNSSGINSTLSYIDGSFRNIT